MSSNARASGKDTSTPAAALSCDKDSFAALATVILEDTLENIVHDIVLGVHREEKMARAKSAAILVEQEAAKLPEPTDSSTEPVTVTTPGAVMENGRIYLRGNPLETTQDVLCPRCRLPRLFFPPSGNGAVTPEPGKNYCARHPPIDKPLHDVWGNPYPSDKKGKAAAAKSQSDLNLKNGSFDSLTSTPSTAGEVVKTATFPSVKCPVCPRYILVQRIGRHMEACYGINKRLSRIAAEAKMDASQSRSSSTPHGSRLGTPTPGMRESPSTKYREETDEDEDDETPKKKKKKLVRKPTDKVPPTKVKKAKDGAEARKTPTRPSPAPSDSKALVNGDAASVAEETPKKKKLKPPVENGSLAKSPKAKEANGTMAVGKAAEDKDGGTTTSTSTPAKSSGGTIKKRKFEAQLQAGDEPSKDDDGFHKRKKQQQHQQQADVAV
ncbi:MAG: hypothetical protein M1817_003745 [Caeruleum heppii]|nr:MAG: hypothetical protein M1817_003745 [Caeruleum heppii]